MLSTLPSFRPSFAQAKVGPVLEEIKEQFKKLMTVEDAAQELHEAQLEVSFIMEKIQYLEAKACLAHPQTLTPVACPSQYVSLSFSICLALPQPPLSLALTIARHSSEPLPPTSTGESGRGEFEKEGQ